MVSPVVATYLSGRVSVLVGDLTKQHFDAIVNAANSSLLGGGGIDGAIHRTGGPEILAECEVLRKTRYPKGLPTGEAVITTAGKMPARFVIHTPGPIYGVDSERQQELLASCYRNCLRIAVENALSTVGFPAISTGIYGYPKEEAAAVASAAVRNFLQTAPKGLKAFFVFFDEPSAKVFMANQVFERTPG